MTPPAPVTLPRTEVHSFTSIATGEPFQIWIGHPLHGWASREGDAPRVLYLLDANLFFGVAVEMTRIMHMMFGELPPILVVGIAYPDTDPVRQARLRTGHFTPSPDATFAEAARALSPPGTPKPDAPPMGGADDFLHFLRQQVDPWVRDRFTVTDGDATLFGSSLGGLFAVHVLRTAPEWVDHIIAASPSLWWNEDELLRQVGESRVKGAGDPARRRLPDVVLAVGSGEEGPAVPQLNRYKLITNTRRLLEHLSTGHLPARSAHLEIIDGESHTSVVPSALTRGLRRLLAP
jgi:predicted alpha/beta superfamily hydrolase